jgi:hypothetical protein
LMSANRAVTVLRSPSTASASAAASPIRTDGTVFCSDAESGAVHCPQNLKPGGFSKRHLGQISASGLVHCPQNFIPSGFSDPHLLQRMIPYCRPAQTLNSSSSTFASLRSAVSKPSVNKLSLSIARPVAEALSFERSCEAGRRAPHHATQSSASSD